MKKKGRSTEVLGTIVFAFHVMASLSASAVLAQDQNGSQSQGFTDFFHNSVVGSNVPWIDVSETPGPYDV